jgi:ABC-type sulfate transport system permease subunit
LSLVFGPGLAPYASIISIILLFVDGLLFGLAAKKGIMSIVLIVIGIILAGVLGLTIPFVSFNLIWSHIVNIVTTQAAANNLGGIFYAFPIFWIIGFAIGIWKG